MGGGCEGREDVSKGGRWEEVGLGSLGVGGYLVRWCGRRTAYVNLGCLEAVGKQTVVYSDHK